MQDHVHFGAPPKLRPRTAGNSRSSLPANVMDDATASAFPSAPERLASHVNAMKSSSSQLLRQRLQSPRPGSAAPQQTPRAPGTAASSEQKGVFMKPPMRPKSATAASRVSRHRMQLVQDPAVALSSNQSEEREAIHQFMGKEDALRPGAASATGRMALSRGKRPFSAAAASSYRASPFPTSNQTVDVSSAVRAASGIKRPHSAAATSRYAQPFRAREKSTSSLTSCLSVVSHSAKAPRSTSASSSRSGQSRGDRLLASTRENADNTFVYAVPRHFLEPGLPYDPYDITPVTHEALFGGGTINHMQDAHWDYYTISRSGYTFHVKSDNFQSTFLSLSNWEAQKAQFAKLRSLTTFSAFRYRKVFLGWRQWVRGNKREAARENLISDSYFSYPVLLQGMVEIRGELLRLAKLQLMWNFDGQTLSLEDFTAANTTFVKARTKELQQVTTRIQTILAGVCRAFLDDTAPLHAGFPGHEFALSVRKSSNFHILESYVQCEQGLASAHQQLVQHKHFRSTRLTTSDAAEARAALLLSSISEYGTRAEKAATLPTPEAGDLADIRWTMASIKRRKCRQLTKFAMLVDFLLLDAFARVVRQSLDLLSSFVLRGANAGTVRQLTDREDLTRAMHQTLGAVWENRLQSAGEGSVDTSAPTRPRSSQRTAITKQLIKAFLHAAWQGKFRIPVSTTEDENDGMAAGTSLSVIAMETKLEALFFHSLSKHADANVDSFSIDGLFHIAETALPQLLVLPHFTAADMSIYTSSSSQKTGHGVDNSSSVEQEVLAIPCLGRQPLFTLDVGSGIKSEKRGRRSYQISFKPDLAELVRTLQNLIVGFTEAFREVPPLLSSPELRSVLGFADDIRALNLHASFSVNSSRRASNATRRCVRFQAEEEEPEHGESDPVVGGAEDHFRCPADRLLERMEEDAHYLSVRDEIQDLTRSVLDGASDLAACYANVLELRQQNESVNFDVKARQFRRNEYSLDQMADDATHFSNQLAALETLTLSTDVEFLRFDMRQLQADLFPSPARCLDAMRELLPRLAREKCDQFLRYINVSSKKIEKPVVQDLDAFTTYLLNLREVYDEVMDKELDLTFLHDFSQVLSKLKFSAPVETMKVFELCDPEFQALKAHVNEAYSSRDTDLHNYGTLLAENLMKLARRMSWLQSAASDQAMAAQSSSCQEARDSAVKLFQEATDMQKEARRLVHIQHVFEEASSDLRPPSKAFEHLNTLSTELKLKSELWNAVCEADEHLNECSSDTIRAVDLDKMGVVASHVDLVVDSIRQCAVQVVGTFELDRLEKLQATLHGLAPVIRDLRNPHLAERHWSKLEHKMQCSLAPVSVERTEKVGEVDGVDHVNASDSTDALVSNRLDVQVQQLLDVDAVAHSTTIRHISEEASAEAAIAGSFLSVVRTWEAREISVEARKDRDGRDVYCVGDCNELTSLIEESQVLLRVMDLSTYSLVVQERLPKLLQDLKHTKESLELLQMCQRKWDFTQRLLSIDFTRTFPEQAKQLQKHDNAWRSLTLGLFNRSLCLPFGVSPDYRQTLVGILEGFEAAAKTLADHLEIKRQVFPAFFQLSDLELATLLSKCRDVSCIPSFLFQCFDNVGQIVFGTGNAFQDILQVTSRAYGGAETIPMGKNLKARGPVEQWLAAVEKRLAEQLRRSTKQAIEILTRYDDVDFSPQLDTSHFPIQSILLADRVVRCTIIDAGLRQVLTTGSSKFDGISRHLDSYSSNVRDQTLPRQERGLRAQVPELSPREITLRTCLFLQEIHYRDALASHVQSTVSSSASAIDWEHQLKYRMDDATTVGHECHVEMNTLNIPYGFSYLNPSQDTVVTPGSLRALFTLFACVRHAQGCVLTGPSESGKRTLSLQVSSLLGRRTFTAAVTSHTHATRLLIGALHSGGTFCASLQLSTSLEACASLIKTLATTLTAIEHAVLTKNPIVGLHRSPVAFLPGTAMLVLLPSTQRSLIDAENLKLWTEALSRFSVVRPDWTYIFEALLASKGFAEPRTLARKVLGVWENARSSFDLVRCQTPGFEDNPFSFAALKAIIAHVGLMKESSADIQEYQQMQIQDAIVQYYRVRVDEEQLHALKRVLESALPCPDKAFGQSKRPKEPVLSIELQESVVLAIRELRFVPRKLLLDAVSSLTEALTFSTSVVLVGASGVGKTASYQVLARALELCLQRRSQGGASVQEPSEPQVRTNAVALSKRSNSYLSKAEKNSPPSVAIRVVLPMALTVTQLYGGVSLDGHGRIPSLMGQLIREAQEMYAPSCTTSEPKPKKSLFDLHNQVWVVFDDALDMRWLEGLLAALTAVASPLLAFEDGEFMTLPPNLRLLFEVTQLHNATPTFLHANAILPLPSELPDDSPAKTVHRRTKNVDANSRMAVATAYLHRYLELQREAAASQTPEASKPPCWTPTNTFNLVERWVLQTSLLAELTAVLDGSVGLSPLQRVTNLTSMLQSLLSSVCALPEPSSAVTKDKFATGSGTPTHFAQELSSAQIRVEMALVYSLLWGFAACTGGESAVQRQVSDLVRREFDHLTPAWISGGADVNLFETLLDPTELRFVRVVGSSSQPGIPLQVTSSSSLNTLFVPTVSSLTVHAAMKEALRSGRGVLLLGDGTSRRTTLARNFLGQLDVIRSILAAGGVSDMTPAHQDVEKAPQPVASKTNEAETLASVKRLRLRQISLVTWMAFRLQKDNNESLQASRAPSASTPDSRTAASIVEAEEGVPLAIAPSMDATKAAMVRQFDRGDVIPFFFAMPTSNSTDVATELASCLERMLQRERTGVFEPPPGKTALLMVDDLHLAVPGANASVQSPSVYAFLRYVQERGVVYRGASCLPTSVENLMLLASMRVGQYSSSCPAEDEPLRKLTATFFPIVAPSCGLEELNHIFGQALQTHWTPLKVGRASNLSTTVRYALPLVVAATTVLWDRFRGMYQFSLQDLARVYEGLAGVEPSLLPDVETLLRLWTHECSQTLREPSMGVCSPLQDAQVASEITRMRGLVAQVAQRRASTRASRLSLGPQAGLSFVLASKRRSVQPGQPANDENASPATLLALFAARSSNSTPSGSKLSIKCTRLSLQYSSLNDQQHHDAMAGGLWAYVPANIYYNGGSFSKNTQVEVGGASSDATDLSARVHRRSSASFMRQQSLETGLGDGDAPHRTLGKHGRWIYAEISFEDDSDAVATATVQAYYRDLRTFSSVAGPRAFKSSKSLSLPRDVPPVPFQLAQELARIDRVFARPAARLIVLDGTNNAVDTLLRFANVSRIPDFPSNGTMLTLSGLYDDANVTASSSQCLTLRWKRLLLELFERVGVAGQEATLVVRRLDLLPAAILNQLQALMTTGEVPGSLSLEEQVHLATRVCDERLLELKTTHAQQVAHIRSEAETARDEALAVLHQKQRDAPATPLLDAFQLVETRYQRELRSKLARVDLRWQQDSDDLRREREVESESVAATVMALTRPLGVTSGKWASAVARMCAKLRVVLVVDKKHERRVRRSIPSVFAACDVVSVPPLDRDALRTLVYGHFHTQVEQLLDDHKSGNSSGLLDFLHQLQRSLWCVVCMATDMHLAVVSAFDEAEDEEEGPSTTRVFLMASLFAKLVVEGYAREEAARAKASWFLDLSIRLDRDLGALRSSDGLLSEQLSTIDKQLTTHAGKLVEQKEDAERIRVIMQRFQVAADEQIHVTNEAQEVAQRELREPMACLEEANRALLLVDRRHIVEIKSFVSPPPLVHLVLGAVCVLFQIEPSWESARRLLLGDANVVQTLLQFNKDAVPAATLARLQAEYLRDERFCREQVERQSVAASSMVGWVRAIHQYASARQQVQPTLDKLERAQSRLNLIMHEFQVSKQRVVEADEAWQATQAAIDAATTRKEALSGEISSLEARCDSGGLALEALQEDRTRQQDAASASSMRRGFSLPSWNALLCAGSLAYACELSSSSRRLRVFQAWEAAYCSYGGLTPGCPPTSTCCTFFPSIAVVLKGSALSSEQVQEHETPLTALFAGDCVEDGNAETEDATKLVTGVAGLGFSRRRLWEASLLSLMAATSTLPVVMITRYSPELEELLVACARRVWNWPQLDMVYARAPDLDDVFRSAARLGHQLLVLDVEPQDSEPSEQGLCLHAALAWTTTRVEGAEQLVVPQRRSGTLLDDDETDVDTADVIALHPSFRLVLTSQASRAAFGEALDTIPALDAALNRSDVADVMVDRIWSSSVGFKLKKALREHARLAQEYEGLDAHLTKLLEAAAVTSQFPLTQTQALRERLASIQQARQGLKQKRREVREELGLVKRQCTPLARTGAAVFNAFNATISSPGPRASSLPMTLPVFLPMLLDVVAASTASRSHLSSVGEVLTKLLTRITPLVPPRGDWDRFLLHVVMALEEPQPTAQERAVSPANAVCEQMASTPRSVGSILLQAKLSSSRQGDAVLSSATVEACKALAMSTSWSDIQRRVVGLIFNGVTAESSAGIDAFILSTLRGVASRSERLRVGLLLFPELVQHVCDRALAGYGVPRSLHRRGSTPSADASDPQQQGLWLQAMRSVPEQTAVLVLTKHDFHSFAFARRVFFHGLENSASVRVRVLQFLSERTFKDGQGKLASVARVGQDEAVPLDQLYVFPRCLNPREQEDESAARQLLLTLEDFPQVAEMEKTQFEALEAAPLAVVSMKNAAPEAWEGLAQILNRSIHRTSSAAFQRHGRIRLLSEGPEQGSQRSTAVGGSRRRSSLSMVRRLSATDLVSPTYPRLVAAVDTLAALPVHLRASAICFRDEEEDEAGTPDQTAASFRQCFQSTVLRLALSPCAQSLSAFTRPSEDEHGEARLPPPDLWQGVTGLVLFHSVLGFRWRVLRSTYVGALPPSVFHYSDDVFLTAISQCLAALTDKQHQPHRTGHAFERRTYQQLVLSSYARLAAGNQELAFLQKLFVECLQLVRCGQPSVDESGTKTRAPSIRQTTIRDQLRGSSLSLGPSTASFHRLSALPASSSSLLLGFLAFPSDGLRRADLSMSEWLDLVWTYSAGIDQSTDGKLRALLLGHQVDDASRRGSLGESCKDLLMGPGGSQMTYCPPPKWMWAFGWAPDPHTLGDVADLTAMIPVRTALEVVQAILSEAFPPRFELESWKLVDEKDDESSPTRPETRQVDPALRTMASVYNVQIQAYSDVFEAILSSLQELERRPDSIASALSDQQLEEGNESEEADSENDTDSDTSLRLAAIEDVHVRQQIAAILRNEIPPDTLGHSSTPPPPITSSWSLHDLLQHFQDWYQFLRHLRPLDSSGPPRWWLPGILASGLPLGHLLEIAQLQHQTPASSVRCTLRFPPQAEEAESTNVDTTADRPLPANTFAILDGLVLLGASWNQDAQRLDPILDLELPQRVQLVCFATSDDHQVCPLALLASHDGDLLLECPFQVDSSRMGPLATPLLVPVGTHFRKNN